MTCRGSRANKSTVAKIWICSTAAGATVQHLACHAMISRNTQQHVLGDDEKQQWIIREIRVAAPRRLCHRHTKPNQSSISPLKIIHSSDEKMRSRWCWCWWCLRDREWKWDDWPFDVGSSVKPLDNFHISICRCSEMKSKQLPKSQTYAFLIQCMYLRFKLLYVGILNISSLKF